MTDPIDEILAEAENPAYHRVAVAKVLLRQDLISRHEELEAEWEQAVRDDQLSNAPDRAPAIAEQIVELEAEMERCERSFKFRSIGYQPWAKLLSKHPPTKQQKAEDPRVDHNPETFPVAAIAASAVEPRLTVEQVQKLALALTNSQFRVLWAKCLEANIGGINVPKSKAPGLTRLPRSGSGGSATDGEFPDQGSLAG